MNDSFHRLLDTIRTLHAPGGCPWDIDQTPLSMRHDLLEECYEAIDAITEGDAAHTKEELGDLLFNTLSLCHMFERRGDFTTDEVLDGVNEKIVRRHPHVFPHSEGKTQMDKPPSNADEVTENWRKIKENVEGRTSESVLDSVPEHFSALQKSLKMLKKAAEKGFTWTSIEQVTEKVSEELREVQEAAHKAEAARTRPGEKPFSAGAANGALDEAQKLLEEEIGDLLMAAANCARWVGFDPEIALERASRKLKKRFQFVERSMRGKAIPMDGAHLDDMLGFWNEAKKH